MNRRDFLLLRTSGKEHVYELSCERLYMHYSDLGSAEQLSGEESGGAAAEPWWSGEPPTERTSPDRLDLFRDLEADLQGADTLRILEPEWLADAQFRQDFETLLQSFRARGGCVQFAERPRSEA